MNTKYLLSSLVLLLSLAGCSNTPSKEEAKLSDIEVVSPVTSYNVNDEFVKPVVNAIYSDKTTKEVTSLAVFSGYDMSIAGDYTVKVSYTEKKTTKEKTYSINVANVGQRVTVGDFTLYLDPDLHGEGYVLESYSGTDFAPTLPTAYGNIPVVMVGEEAFKDNENIANIVIPNSYLSIFGYAFSGCKNLVSLYIPKTVTYIGEYIVKGDYKVTISCEMTSSELADLIEDYSVDADWNKGVYNSPAFGVSVIPTVGKEGDFIFTKTSTDVFVNAFVGNKYTTALELPNTYNGEAVTKTGVYSFHDMIALEEIVIPDSYVSIQPYSFSNNLLLEKVTLGENLKYINSCAFEKCASLNEIKFNSKLETIGNWSFAGCSSITSLELPSTLTSIGISAFRDSNLSTLIIPDSVKTIENYAFSGNTNLNTLVLGSGLTGIASYAFDSCGFLGDKAFYHGDATMWASVKEAMSSSHFEFPEVEGKATTVYFYSETTPATEGNYWHYVDGVVTIY